MKKLIIIFALLLIGLFLVAKNTFACGTLCVPCHENCDSDPWCSEGPPTCCCPTGSGDGEGGGGASGADYFTWRTFVDRAPEQISASNGFFIMDDEDEFSCPAAGVPSTTLEVVRFDKQLDYRDTSEGEQRPICQDSTVTAENSNSCNGLSYRQTGTAYFCWDYYSIVDNPTDYPTAKFYTLPDADAVSGEAIQYNYTPGNTSCGVMSWLGYYTRCHTCDNDRQCIDSYGGVSNFQCSQGSFNNFVQEKLLADNLGFRAYYEEDRHKYTCDCHGPETAQKNFNFTAPEAGYYSFVVFSYPGQIYCPYEGGRYFTAEGLDGSSVWYNGQQVKTDVYFNENETKSFSVKLQVSERCAFKPSVRIFKCPVNNLSKLRDPASPFDGITAGTRLDSRPTFYSPGTNIRINFDWKFKSNFSGNSVTRILNGGLLGVGTINAKREIFTLKERLLDSDGNWENVSSLSGPRTSATENHDYFSFTADKLKEYWLNISQFGSSGNLFTFVTGFAGFKINNNSSWYLPLKIDNILQGQVLQADTAVDCNVSQSTPALAADLWSITCQGGTIGDDPVAAQKTDGGYTCQTAAGETEISAGNYIISASPPPGWGIITCDGGAVDSDNSVTVDIGQIPTGPTIYLQGKGLIKGNVYYDDDFVDCASAATDNPAPADDWSVNCVNVINGQSVAAQEADSQYSCEDLTRGQSYRLDIDLSDNNWTSYVCPNTSVYLDELTKISPEAPNIFISKRKPAWWQVVGGDLYADGNITSILPSISDYLLTNISSSSIIHGIVQSTGLLSLGPIVNSIENIAEDDNDWSAENVGLWGGKLYNYNFWNYKMSGKAKGEFDGTPDQDGVFIAPEGTLTIGGTGWSNITNKIFIIHNGDLTIDGNIIIPQNSGSLVVVVSGDIEIDDSVTEIDGYFIANGTINTGHNSLGDSQLIIGGGLIGFTGVSLQRDFLSTQNNTTPAEKFVFRPDILVNLNKDILTTDIVKWQEVAP